MSVRPEVYGFSLDVLDRGIRSQSAEFLSDAISKLNDWEGHCSEAEIGAGQDVLRRAANEGFHWPDLEVESNAHVLAAVALSQINQEPVPTDSSSRNMLNVIGWARLIYRHVPEPGRRLLQIWIRGRPFFGKRIVTDWGFYGFLNRRQSIEMRTALLSWRDSGAEIDDSPDYTSEGCVEISNDVIQWLNITIDANADLFMFCL